MTGQAFLTAGDPNAPKILQLFDIVTLSIDQPDNNASVQKYKNLRIMTQENMLATWIAEEEKLLGAMANGRLVGALNQEKVKGLSGLEVMQAVIRGDLPNGNMATTMNYLIMEAAPGRAVVQGNPNNSVLNVQGFVHGGWFATIMDAALGNAIHTMLPAGKGYTTLDLSVKMTRALLPTVGRVRAIGTIIQVGRTIALAEGRLIGPDGKLHATATTTCMVVDPKR